MEVRDKNILIGRGKDLLFDVAQGFSLGGGVKEYLIGRHCNWEREGPTVWCIWGEEGGQVWGDVEGIKGGG